MFKPGRLRALGAMSGTSLDGVDAAVIETDGHEVFAFGPTAFQPYTGAQQATLRAALGKWPEDDIAEATEIVETVHAQVLSRFDDVDVVGFHGQTLAHDPGGRGTNPTGDGALLAATLNQPLVWAYRSAHVDSGVHGAPRGRPDHIARAMARTPEAHLAFVLPAPV